MEFILIIGFVGLIIWISNLNSRISTLEYQFYNKTKIPEKEVSHSKTKAKSQTNKVDTDLFPWEDATSLDQNGVHTKTAKQSTQAAPTKEFHLEEFLGGRFFAILGATSIVLAIGFFSAWAFSNGLIGPKGRIAIGILFSIIILGLGEFLRPKYPKFFDKVSASGIGGLLITTYLARNYNFDGIDYILNGTQAFWSYTIIVATGIFLSLRYQARFLGSFSILAGIIIPLLVNSEPNPIGLLSYISILTIAGFSISLYQKWPEILGFLFLGISGYLSGIYHLETPYNYCSHQQNPTCDATTPWVHITPLIFLLFVYSLNFLLGSGGIIRSINAKVSQKWNKLSGTNVFEVLLFILAIFSANLLGHAVFDNQEWSHFGFFVLAQGFGFFFLSELFKAKKLEIFQKLALSATMISIIFATIWEISTENSFVLSLLLTLEGALFCFAGRSTKELIFQIFGRIALLLAFVWVFQINNFNESSISILALIGFIFYSIGVPKTLWDKIWTGIGIILASIDILYWSFEKLTDFIKTDFLTFVVPVLWGIMLAYSVLKTRNNLSRIAGLTFIIIVSFLGWESLSDGNEFENLLTLGLLLLGHFTILSSFYIDEKDLQENTTTKKVSTIIVLGLSTATVLFFGSENLDEPFRTIAWIAWGSLLFGLGNSKSWPHFRYFGIGIFLTLIAKLYLLDVWKWDPMMKFLAFLAIGVALLSVAFLYNKKKD